MKDFDLYSFVYRGVLTEETLDRAGRRRRNHFGAEEAREAQKSLSYEFIFFFTPHLTLNVNNKF